MKSGRAFQGKRKSSDNLENIVEIDYLSVTGTPGGNVCVLGLGYFFS